MNLILSNCNINKNADNEIFYIERSPYYSISQLEEMGFFRDSMLYTVEQPAYFKDSVNTNFHGYNFIGYIYCFFKGEKISIISVTADSLDIEKLVFSFYAHGQELSRGIDLYNLDYIRKRVFRNNNTLNIESYGEYDPSKSNDKKLKTWDRHIKSLLGMKKLMRKIKKYQQNRGAIVDTLNFH